MKSDVMQSMTESHELMQQLISKQKFTVGDAQKFMDYYYNIIRKMEDLEQSRNDWRKKYLELKERK